MSQTPRVIVATSSGIRVHRSNLDTSSSHQLAPKYSDLVKRAKQNDEGAMHTMNRIFMERIGAANTTNAQYGRASGKACRARFVGGAFSLLVEQLRTNHSRPEKQDWSLFEDHNLREKGLPMVRLSLYDKVVLITTGGAVAYQRSKAGILTVEEDGYHLLLGTEHIILDAETAYALITSAPEEEVPYDDPGVFPTPARTVNLNGRSVVVRTRDRGQIRISMTWRTYLCLVCASGARAGLKRFTREAGLLQSFFGEATHIPANRCEAEGFWKYRWVEGREGQQLKQAAHPGGILDSVPLAALRDSVAWQAHYCTPEYQERLNRYQKSAQEVAREERRPPTIEELIQEPNRF